MSLRLALMLVVLLFTAAFVHADAGINNGSMDGAPNDHSNGQGLLVTPPGWTPVNVNTDRGDRLSVEPSDRPGGGQCLHVKTFGGDAGVYQTIAPLEKGRAYLVSAWVKRLSGTVNLEAYSHGWGPAIMRGLDSHSEGWTRLTVGCNTEDDGAHLYLVAWMQADFLIDDIEIHPAAAQVTIAPHQQYDFSGRWRYPVTINPVPGAPPPTAVDVRPVSENLPREGFAAAQRVPWPAGRAINTMVSVPIRREGNFVVEVSDPTTGAVLGDSSSTVLAGDPWVVSFPTKDSLYATLGYKWPLRVTLAGGGSTPTKGLAAQATLSNAAGKIMRQLTAPASDKVLTVPLSGAGLAPGDYRLRVAVTQGRRQLYNTERPLRILPRGAHEVVVAPDGATLVDGKPFFPIGLYWVLANPAGWKPGPERKTEDLLELRRMGFNTLHTYAFEHNDGNDTDDNAVAYLDMAQELGFKVMMGLRRDWYQGKELNVAAIEARVKRLKGHPALLNWTLWDEPDSSVDNVPRVQEVYDLVNRADPYHPASPVFMSGGGRPFRSAADVNLFDCYPANGNGGILPRVLAGAQAALPDKPMWYVARAYQQGESLPSEQEMMKYWQDALAANVKAILWYSYGGDAKGWDSIRVTPEFFAGVKRVIRALADKQGEQ